MAKNTLLVNLYGAPGAGKSTGAAYLFYKLKSLGISAELITEFAKDKVWEENDAVFENQCYIFGKQSFRLSRVYGKVDVMVTDSPLLVSAYYTKGDLRKPLIEAAKVISRQYKSINIFINRVKKYNPDGRFQTEEESDVICNDLKKFIKDDCEEFFIEIDGNEDGYDKVLSEIKYENNQG